jgi:hypothetical protein
MNYWKHNKLAVSNLSSFGIGWSIEANLAAVFLSPHENAAFAVPIADN